MKMEGYCGEAMNAHRDAVSAHNADVEQACADAIAAGAVWDDLVCEDKYGERFPAEILAFSEDDAFRDAALTNSFVLQVISVKKQETAPAP
jgi:hypothetical protein